MGIHPSISFSRYGNCEDNFTPRQINEVYPHLWLDNRNPEFLLCLTCIEEMHKISGAENYQDPIPPLSYLHGSNAQNKWSRKLSESSFRGWQIRKDKKASLWLYDKAIFSRIMPILKQSLNLITSFLFILLARRMSVNLYIFQKKFP